MPINKVNGKKDGKQKYRVRVNYTDSFGHAHQIERTAYGLDEARAVEAKLKYDIDSKGNIPKNITVKQLYYDYIETKKYEVRASTLYKTQTTLEKYILPVLGDTRINKLAPPVLQQWKKDIMQKGFAIKTQKNIYSEFRTMLNYAVTMEYIGTNPLVKVGNFKSTITEQKEMDFYTPEEFKKFISAAKAHAEKSNIWGYYVFFNIAFFTGARKGEINALTWKDIKDGCISISKSVNQKAKDCPDIITAPKNKSSIRCIQIPTPLQQVLDEHYKRCQEQYYKFNDNFNICGGIRALRNTSIQNENIKYSDEAGIKTIRIHDFRHSHASLLAHEGINIQEIARRLGHSNANITLSIYSHLYPAEQERALMVLNKINI